MSVGFKRRLSRQPKLELDSPSLWSASIQPTWRTYIHTYIHTCLLLLILMLWHRQAIFESKGDKLSSSAECRIRTHQGLRHQIASRLNARWQTDWAIEDQAKIWTRQPVPLISEHSAHSTPQPFWHSHLALAIYMFVVVNVDALAREVSRHLFGSRLNAHSQTDWAIEDQAKKKLELTICNDTHPLPPCTTVSYKIVTRLVICCVLLCLGMGLLPDT